MAADPDECSLAAAESLEQQYESLLSTTAALKSSAFPSSSQFPQVSPSPERSSPYSMTPSSLGGDSNSAPSSPNVNTSDFLLSATDPNVESTPADIVGAREMPSPRQLGSEPWEDGENDAAGSDDDNNDEEQLVETRPGYDEFEGSGFHSHMPDSNSPSTVGAESSSSPQETDSEEDAVVPLNSLQTDRSKSIYSEATSTNSFNEYDDAVGPENDGFYDNPRVSGDWSGTNLAAEIRAMQSDGQPAQEQNKEEEEEEEEEEDWAQGRKSFHSKDGREWVECEDGEGNVYYAEKATGETKWELADNDEEIIAEEGLQTQDKCEEDEEIKAAAERAQKREVAMAERLIAEEKLRKAEEEAERKFALERKEQEAQAREEAMAAQIKSEGKLRVAAEERLRRAEEEAAAAKERARQLEKEGAETMAARIKAEEKLRVAAEEKLKRAEEEAAAAKERARQVEADAAAAQKKAEENLRVAASAEKKLRRAEEEVLAAKQKALKLEDDAKAAEEKLRSSAEKKLKRAEEEAAAAKERARKIEEEAVKAQGQFRVAAEEKLKRAEAEAKAAKERAQKVEKEGAEAMVAQIKSEEKLRVAAEEKLKRAEEEAASAKERARTVEEEALAAKVKAEEQLLRVEEEAERRFAEEEARVAAERALRSEEALVAKLKAEEKERLAAEEAERLLRIKEEEDAKKNASRASQLEAVALEAAEEWNAAEKSSEQDEVGQPPRNLAGTKKATPFGAQEVARKAAEEWDAAESKMMKQDNVTPHNVYRMTTAYGADTPHSITTPFSPPPMSQSMDMPSSIFQSLMETQTKLDEELVDFHETSNAPRSASQVVVSPNGSNFTDADASDSNLGALTVPNNEISAHEDVEVSLVDTSFAEIAITDKIAIRVAKIPKAIEEYLESKNLRIAIDARLENTLAATTAEDEAENDFVDLSQITEGDQSGGVASLTRDDARLLTGEVASNMKSWIFNCSLLIGLLSMVFFYDATARNATRFGLGALKRVVPLDVLTGESPTVTIRADDDNWCFSGTIFRPCTAEHSSFKAVVPASSGRYRQFKSVSSEGMCVGANKKGVLGLKSCVTNRGITMDGTVFEYEGGVLGVRDMRGEMLCVVRGDHNVGRVGKCSEVGYTRINIGAVVNSAAPIGKFLRFEDNWIGVVGLDELGGGAVPGSADGVYGDAGEGDVTGSFASRVNGLFRRGRLSAAQSTNELDFIDEIAHEEWK
jgi:hypothetical protein